MDEHWHQSRQQGRIPKPRQIWERNALMCEESDARTAEAGTATAIGQFFGDQCHCDNLINIT